MVLLEAEWDWVCKSTLHIKNINAHRILDLDISWKRKGMVQRQVSEAGERVRANVCGLNGGIIPEFAWRYSG